MHDSSGSSFLSHSFTDLMASLAVIFILLSVVFIHNAAKRREIDKDLIKSSLSEVLAKNKLPLRQDPNDPLVLSVSMGEDVLKFPLNSSALSAGGAQFLDKFMPFLTEQLCSEPIRSKIDSIIIEGHTDRSGETNPEGIRRNIRLSQARSFAVLERGLRAIQNSGDQGECMLKLASATGRGSRMPVEVNGKYDPDLSRRVEIKIRVKSREESVLEALRKN